jgi:type IV pilus assembly protein PilW
MTITKHSSSLRPQTLHQRGFSLVEIMVGLAIGMLALLVVLQIFSIFERQKQVTTGTADAQTNGSVALYNISRELRLAGYPIMYSSVATSETPLECTNWDYHTADTGISEIFPVSISDGAAASGVNSSDTLTIRYGNSPMGGIPVNISDMGPGLNVVQVRSNLGCSPKDFALISNKLECALTTISEVSATSTVPVTYTLTHLTPVSTIKPGANIACLGNQWSTVTFSVVDGNLARNGTVMVEGIVNIQAQYGISDNPNSNNVTQWVEPSGAQWSIPSVFDRNRIKAIRVAVVARNSKMEGVDVTNACSGYAIANPSGLCAWAGSVASPAPAITLAGDPNWKKYRYRVFETIIPLRNIIWSRGVL